jgi:hypothetical protein
MMTHEYDAYLDSLPDEVVIDDQYDADIVLMEQQMQDEAEMKEAYDAELKQQGAREALLALRSELTGNNRQYGVYKAEDGRDTIGTTSAGLAVAIQAVDALLRDTKGGAA